MSHFVNLTRLNGDTIMINPETVVAIMEGGARSSILVTTAQSQGGGPFLLEVTENTEQVDSALSI